MLSATAEECRELSALIERMQRHARLLDIFASSPDLLCLADRERFLFVSQSWTRVLGWSEEELTSRTWLSLVHPEDLEPARQALELGRIEHPIVTRYAAKDGHWVRLRWRFAAPWQEGVTHACASPEVTA